MSDVEGVIITKDGLVRNVWNDGSLVKRLLTSDEEIFRNLRYACEIEEGVTLLDIMRIVEDNPILTMFLGEYSWCSEIDAFHNQVNEDIRSKEIDPDYDDNMTHLEVYWEAHYHRDKSLSLSPGFHGWGHCPEFDRPTGYAVEFTPLYDLADYPVKLNTNINVYSPFPHEGPLKIALEGTQHFSLLEVLDAIYWEVSFCGGPEEVAAQRRELLDRVDDIESGEAELRPIDEMFDFIDDDDIDVDDDQLRYFDFEEGIDDD